MLITFYDAYSVLTKVYGGEFLKQAINNTLVRESSRAHLNKLCYGVLDRHIALDYIISKKCKKAPKLPIKIILKIGLYSIKYLNTPPYAVTDTCVELAKKLGKGGTGGFINAVLRSYVREGCAELETTEDLSIKYSCPKFIVDRLIKDYGKQTAIQILAFDQEKTYVRFNTDVDGQAYLEKIGKAYEKTPFDDTFLVNNFQMNQDFYDGVYTFQSIGSVAICNLVGSGETLLDACAAPGGKSVKLANNFRSVMATDIHPHRVELINSYASRMGAHNVTVAVKDSSEFCAEFEGAFDVVLCDAPCSGTGVLKDNPDIKLNRKPDSIFELCKTQFEILNNLKNYVKEKGYLCYSTCSLLKDENDRTIEKFLKENPNYIVEEVNSPLKHLKSQYGITFLPHISEGAGFYFSKLKRLN